MQRVVRGSTNYIRQRSNPTTVDGTARIPELYIHVRWHWLAIPLSLVLLSWLFLSCIHGFLHGEMSSHLEELSLAMIYHGLSAGHHEELDAKTMTDMDDIAGGRWARLAEVDDGEIMLFGS